MSQVLDDAGPSRLQASESDAGPPRRPSLAHGRDHLLLNVDEVADLLRTSRKAVYALVDRGQLPGVTRLGRRLLFRRDDLLRWLDQKRAHALNA